MMHKIGSLSPMIYFVNFRDTTKPKGYLMMAPFSDMPAPEGWRREEAGTLRECYQLQKRIQEQEIAEWKAEAQHDMDGLRARFKRTRDAMMTRMASSSTTPYDREFMQHYLQLQESKLEKHERNFECHHAYLNALEFDTPKGRRDDEESVNLDRINF